MKKAGFTLVELLIVVSVILISVGIAGDLIVSVVRSYNKTRIFNEIEQNANFVIPKITYELKNARNIVSFSGSSITYTDSSGVDHTISRSTSSPCSSGVACLIHTSGGSTQRMTNEDPREGVHVTSFAISMAADESSARFNMTLDQPVSITSPSNTASISYVWVIDFSGVP